MHFAALLIPLPCSTYFMAYYILQCLLCFLSPRGEMLSRPGRRQFQLNRMLTILFIWLFGHGNKPILSHTAPSGVTLLLTHCLLLTILLGGILHTIASAARWLHPQHTLLTACASAHGGSLTTPATSSEHISLGGASGQVAVMTKGRPIRNRAVLWLWKPNDESAFPGQLASYCFSYNELS